MTKVTIYHNPRCSKSRQALKILEEKGCSITIVEYLKDNPTLKDLQNIHKLLNCSPLEFIRIKESTFKELGLSKNDQKSDNDWLKIIADYPILLERPIVIVGKQAVVARPPENVLDLI